MFILVYIKIFFDSFQSVLKLLFHIQIIVFVKKLIVSNFLYLNFLLCFIKLSTKISAFSKFVPKFYFKICQT